MTSPNRITYSVDLFHGANFAFQYTQKRQMLPFGYLPTSMDKSVLILLAKSSFRLGLQTRSYRTFVWTHLSPIWEMHTLRTMLWLLLVVGSPSACGTCNRAVQKIPTRKLWRGSSVDPRAKIQGQVSIGTASWKINPPHPSDAATITTLYLMTLLSVRFSFHYLYYPPY